MRSGDEFADRYVLKQVVGTGRGGDVWLAHDTVVGQDVALKPERTDGTGETSVRRLLGEPRAMAKFRDHPHVVTLFDVVTTPPDGSGQGQGNGQGDGPGNGRGDGPGDGGAAHSVPAERTFWFVMEYVPGGGLDHVPPVSPARAARIGAQLADALAALHEAGVVHCDVKPANVGLTRHGTAKLLDFGAAYRAGGTETITVNGPSSFTPDYAAPELARGNVPRPASDVFCLAATVHALVTGAPPRGGAPDEATGPTATANTGEATAPTGKANAGDETGPAGATDDGDEADRLRHWKAEQGVVELDPAVGPLRPVLTAMLHRDPRQRPDAAEARRLLEGVAGTDPASASPSPGTPGAVAGTVTGRRLWRRPLLVAVLGVSTLVALGLVAVQDHGDDGRAASSPPRPGQGRTADGAANGGSGALIGDPRTADVCALADPAALDQFGDGDVRVDVDYGNFDRCDVLVGVDDRTRIDTSIRLLDGSPPEGSKPVRTVGRIGIREEPAESDECKRLLTYGGDTGARVEVRVNMGKGSVVGGNATLCTVADKAAAGAAGVLDRGPVPRRSPAYPRTSLAWTDACGLLDAEALSAVPGLKVDVPEVGVANWRCKWSSDVDELDATIAFFRDQPRSAVGGATSTTLSGYRTVVGPDDDDTCTAFVEYRRYSGQDAETAAEMVRLDVGGQRPTDQLCTMATDLAADAAAALRAR
ncbi:serine/threonine-protein kinase [Streptomyces sp. NPDC057245]|uniref:serine/threonine-protein kinase n=1 Tax=Streptomyces TaxID=1883 RepID=UPI001C1E0495|nr:serine/threonine-protein kinase [Streptomyces sp. A108]MBU6532341.1 serine/threonine protein kinase [Streptomyces sp. A108]